MIRRKTKYRETNPNPKPWRISVLRLQIAKFRKRTCWNRKRWARFNDERDARRDAPPRPVRMQRRLELLERERDFQIRSQRMLDYHARRRAKLAAAAAEKVPLS